MTVLGMTKNSVRMAKKKTFLVQLLKNWNTKHGVKITIALLWKSTNENSFKEWEGAGKRINVSLNYIVSLEPAWATWEREDKGRRNKYSSVYKLKKKENGAPTTLSLTLSMWQWVVASLCTNQLKLAGYASQDYVPVRRRPRQENQECKVTWQTQSYMTKKN